MFNSAFNEFAKKPDLDLYPEELRANIDAVNEWVRSLRSSSCVQSCGHVLLCGSCIANEHCAAGSGMPGFSMAHTRGSDVHVIWPGVPHHQQRRVPLRICPEAGRLRGGLQV